MRDPDSSAVDLVGYLMADRRKRSHLIVIGTVMVAFGTLALVFVHLLAVVAVVPS